MSNEQAIAVLQGMIKNPLFSGKSVEAFEMAIKALEQEPCNSCCNGEQTDKAKLCQKSYLAGMEHAKQEPCEDAEIQADYDAQKAAGMTDEEWEYGGDAVSRQEVLDAVHNADMNAYDERSLLNDIKQAVNELPPVQPKRHGHWEDLHRCWICSECQHETHIEHDFCPKCGSYNGG